MLPLLAGVIVLADNQGNNQAIQGQGFRKNKHDEHTNEKLVLIVGSADIVATRIIRIGYVRVPSSLGCVGWKHGNGRSTVTNSSDAVVSNYSNATSSHKSRDTAAESSGELQLRRVRYCFRL